MFDGNLERVGRRGWVGGFHYGTLARRNGGAGFRMVVGAGFVEIEKFV
jgi:hypothetical protein